jgi:hypothetical protein
MLIGLNSSNVESAKGLAFYLGQTMKSVKFSEKANIKTIERLLTGYLYLGCWLHFLPISNP